MRDHGIVRSHGALLSRHIFWHLSERLSQLRRRHISTVNWLLVLYYLQLGFVSIEHRYNKLFELHRWNLLVVGCEFVFELLGRDLRAEPRHFDLFLLSGGILRGFFGKQRLFELRRGDLPSAHRPTRMHTLPIR